MVAMALLAGACGTDDGSVPVPGGEPPPSTSVVTSTPPRAVDYGRPEAPRRVGTGFLDGASPDGRAAYVEEERPEFPEVGCEGQPQPVLVRLDLDDGRREVLATPQLAIRGEVVSGRGGRVVLADGCEGFLSRLVVGTETPDGRLRDLREVPLAEGGGPINPASISWSRDAATLVGAQGSVPDGDPRVVRIDPGTGSVTPLFAVAGLGEVLLRVAELEGGGFAVAGGGRVELRTGDGRRESLADGNDFTVAPDGRTLIVFGRTVALLGVGQGPSQLVGADSGREITSADVAPDGRAVVYLTSSEGGADNRVRLVTLDDRRMVDVVGSGQWGRVLFSGDGAAVLFNQFFEAPRFVPDVVAVAFSS